MICPNCNHKFSLWEGFKLSNLFRVKCSQCNHEVVKDTAAFQSFYSTFLGVTSSVFLCWVFFGEFSLLAVIFVFPVQMIFDQQYAALRSLGFCGGVSKQSEEKG
jgi:uncharacterized membrane protein